MGMNKKFYRGDPYWQNEQPEYANAGKIRVAYYPEAGKLHFSVLYRTFEDAEVKIGKTVVIDEEQFRLNPSFGALLKKVVEEWQ